MAFIAAIACMLSDRREGGHRSACRHLGACRHVGIVAVVVAVVSGRARGTTVANPQPHQRGGAELGSDCVARVEAKLSQVAHELAEWRTLALSTDHDDARS
jgi:hypothetical protein